MRRLLTQSFLLRITNVLTIMILVKALFLALSESAAYMETDWGGFEGDNGNECFIPIGLMIHTLLIGAILILIRKARDTNHVGYMKLAVLAYFMDMFFVFPYGYADAWLAISMAVLCYFVTKDTNWAQADGSVVNVKPVLNLMVILSLVTLFQHLVLLADTILNGYYAENGLWLALSIFLLCGMCVCYTCFRHTGKTRYAGAGFCTYLAGMACFFLFIKDGLWIVDALYDLIVDPQFILGGAILLGKIL